MSTALTLSTAPAALQAFADSRLLREVRVSPEIAVSAFTELSAACNLHLDAKATTPEHFSEILEVLALSFPAFRISEISPAFRAYSAGLLDIAEEDMKTYGQPLKPAQVRKIFAGYQSHHFALAKKLEAAQAPQLTPEQEMEAAITALNEERQHQFDGWLSGATPRPAKWGELIATDCKAVMEANPDLFAPYKAAAYAAAQTLTSTQIAEEHYGWTLLDTWNIERRYWLRTYGQDPKTPVDADPVPTAVVYAVYAKLCVWAALQEVGQP